MWLFRGGPPAPAILRATLTNVNDEAEVNSNYLQTEMSVADLLDIDAHVELRKLRKL